MDTANVLQFPQSYGAISTGLGHASDRIGAADWRNQVSQEPFSGANFPPQLGTNAELPHDIGDFERQLNSTASLMNNVPPRKLSELRGPNDAPTAARVAPGQTIYTNSAIAREHLPSVVESQALAQTQYVQDVPTSITTQKQMAAVPVAKSAIPAASVQTTPVDGPALLAMTTAAVTTSPTTQHIFGLDVLDFYDPRAAQAIVDLGVKWVRIDFNRSFIEPSSRTYNWSDYDSFLLKMQKAGVQVLAQVTSTPAWISWSNWTAQYTDTTRFFTDIVNRYKPGGLVAQAAGWGSYGITTWELFNEPNLAGYGWLNYGSNAMMVVNNYAKVISLADDAVHRAAPGAKTLLGGLSSEGRPDLFLTALYTAGAKSSFDVMAFHPYGWDNRFGQLATSIDQFMGQYGDAAKPIWYDEYGTTDQSKQISMLQSAWAQRNTVDALFWFSLKDINATDQRYGLVDSNYKPKPIYSVFKELMKSA